MIVYKIIIKEEDWLFHNKKIYKDEFPRMAVVARDYLVILASEVVVERLFSKGRDLLGVRRYSLNVEIIKKLMLLRDMYQNEEAK